jgi:hypothetical protein
MSRFLRELDEKQKNIEQMISYQRVEGDLHVTADIEKAFPVTPPKSPNNA